MEKSGWVGEGTGRSGPSSPFQRPGCSPCRPQPPELQAVGGLCSLCALPNQLEVAFSACLALLASCVEISGLLHPPLSSRHQSPLTPWVSGGNMHQRASAFKGWPSRQLSLHSTISGGLTGSPNFILFFETGLP